LMQTRAAATEFAVAASDGGAMDRGTEGYRS